MNIIAPNIPSHTVCIGLPHSLQIRFKATKGCSSHFPHLVQVTLIFLSMTRIRLLESEMINYFCLSIGSHFPLALADLTHVFPVTPSTSSEPEVPSSLYLSGLVKLKRRIAARTATTPSLNCVLVILKEIRRQCVSAVKNSNSEDKLLRLVFINCNTSNEKKHNANSADNINKFIPTTHVRIRRQ